MSDGQRMLYRVITALVVLSTVAGAGSSAPKALTALPPRISDVDRHYLTRLIRHTLLSRAQDKPLPQPRLVPPALDDLQCQIVVTLREGGFARGIGVSDRTDAIAGARQAAILAFESAKVGGADSEAFLNNVRIEVQALGEVVPFRSEKNWTEPGALDGFLTAGLDGVMLYLDQEQRWFTPAEMISKNVTLAEALRTLGKEVSLNPHVLNEARLSKFRALHWWEFDDAGHIASLVRGLSVVPQSDVTPVAIDAAIGRIGDYIVYRQLPQGRFTYSYNPAAVEYTDTDSEVAQSGATWAVAVYAAYRDAPPVRRALRRAIHARLERWIEFPAAHGAFLTESDTRNRLGVTAQFYLALNAATDGRRYASSRSSLLNAMLWLHQSDGAILPAFPPARKLDTQERYSGQALLAFAQAYQNHPSQRLLDAIDSSFSFYRARFADRHLPAMVPWFSQAYAIMARLTRKRAYADFVYEMSDLTLDYQLTPDNSDAPEMWGAFEAPGVFSAGASTALLLQGLCQAARTARFFGDKERYQRYKTACVLATRFVMQLEFKPPECYFVKSPTDVLGGIRTSPVDVRLLIDNAQHALIGLVAVQQLLADDQP